MIRRLDKQLVNKIAAGEVVERPLSVVKELTENAIDAGAGVITVEIKDGGLSSIRVTDNGCGIPGEEIMLAFAQHATSKISDIDDLSRIGTLGFRGEALASIASVSHVDMITKTQGALTGIKVEMHGGTLITKQEVGCTEGTTLVVSNLFFNTPARLKFLKKPSVEAGYVTDLMQRLALGYPHLAFRYISNGQPIISTNGNGDQKAIIYQIYGMESARGLLAIEDNQIVSGYIGKPEIARGSRNALNFFINGRYIRSELLNKSVEETYRTMLPVGKFPLCVLHLHISPQDVDVNVHPAKLEVRFANEREIYNRVSEAVRGVLGSNELVPSVHVARPDVAEPDMAQLHVRYEPERLTLSESQRTQRPHHSAQVVSDTHHLNANSDDGTQTRNFTISHNGTQAHDFTIITQLFNTYWLAHKENELYFIDQHAAHERIIYEEMLHKLKNEEHHAQPLLEPYKLNLSPIEAETAIEYKHILEGFGFDIEISEQINNEHTSSGNTLTLLSVPLILKGPVDFAFFTHLLDKLENGESDTAHDTEVKIREEVALAACKSAVKAKDSLSPPEARMLIDRMLALENPYTCPHGRPTMIKISRREIERMFKRV